MSSPLELLGEIFDRTHLTEPDQLPTVIATTARACGWDVSIYLADYEQRELRPLSDDVHPDRIVQPVDGPAAGQCFREAMIVWFEAGAPRAWVPLIDGVDRLGVIELGWPPGLDGDRVELAHELSRLGHFVAQLLGSKGDFGDSYHTVRIAGQRTTEAELLWSLLPPLTVACERAVIAGLLEPTNAVAGDVFDYAIDQGVAHVGIGDATGHDLDATIMGALTLAAYRASRRRGATLPETLRALDSILLSRNERWLVTAVFGQLDIATGMFSYVNAGHPPPLLLREGRAKTSLKGGRRVLLGIGGADVEVASEQLEPGDWLILYTDGVTEGRNSDGVFFGEERLAEVIEAVAGEQHPLPESLRLIMRAVIDHQQGLLRDDATMVIVQWRTHPEAPLAG